LELDGLRAIAIALVLMLHSTPLHESPFASVIGLGWMGVDLFFVLSGFLITGILLDAKGAPAYYRTFYARRILRIWPVYFLLLFVVLYLIPAIRPQTHDLLRFPVWSYFLFVQNFYRFDDGPPVLNATWSLGVEEQFYLVWPLLISLLSRKNLARLVVIGLALSPLIRHFSHLASNDWFLIYEVTFCRMDGLLLGSAIALFVRSSNFSPARLKNLGLAAVAVGAIPAVVICYKDFFYVGLRSIWTYTFVDLAFAGVVAVVLGSKAESMLSRALRLRPLQHIGKVSYGLYLLHKLTFVVLDKAHFYERFKIQRAPVFSALLLFAAEFAIAVGVATFSWWALEERVLRLKTRFSFQGKRLQAKAVSASA
jgi:peptidoglycan/LPS O-acetylase OafA/YrhL